MLNVIVAVTMTAPDIGAVEAAYGRHLDYRVVDHGELSRAHAEALGAPATADRPYSLLQPASGAAVYLRVVQAPAARGYEAMKTHGWNANEILVRDPDALARELEGSPFRMIGPPRPLASNPSVRATQVIGPAGELVYLTRIPPEGGKIIRTPARSRVDRTFIVVVGGPDMEAMRAFYRDRLHMPVTEAGPTTIDVLNRAWNLPATHQTPLALARLPPDFAIELDEYPKQARPRELLTGELPPGMAMVSFEVTSLDAFELEWKVPPAPRHGKPYDGRRAAIAVGAAGEWIELIEAR